MNKRYIRTKDDLYDTKNLMYRTIKDNKVYRVGYDVEKPTFEADIIAEADTPEELCDLYIDEETKTIFHKHNGYVVNYRTNYVYSLESLIKVFHSIKGAIYTDEGLIYVIKMNDKGDWEII